MSNSTVDTRVVEMQFNNKQFEENVQVSMSTLKDLQNMLNSTESAKGLEKLADTAKTIDLSSISESLEAIQSRFSTMGIVGMTIIQNLTNSAISGLKSAASYITNLVKTGGINRAMKIEQAKFSLEGLGVAWEKVSNQISFAVNDTAYGLDAAASASSALIASGVGVGNVAKQLTSLGKAGEVGTDYIDDLGMSLKAISGVAAQTNSDYSSIANIFTTVAGQGKLMTMQLNQLANRGLNAAAILGKSLGKTEAEVREMVTDGEIDFNTFAEVMYDNFAEHAAAANNTLTGVTANIKSAFGKIGAAIIEPIIQNEGPLVKMLDTIRAKVNELKKAIAGIDQFASEVAYVANQAINTVKYSLQGIDITSMADALNKLGDKIMAIGQYFFTSAPVTADAFSTYFASTFDDANGSLDVFKEKLVESGTALTGLDISQLVKDSGSFEESLKANWLTADVFQRTLAYAAEYTEAFANGEIEATKASKKEYKQMKLLLKQFSSGEDVISGFYEQIIAPSAFDYFIDGLGNIFKVVDQIMGAVKSAFADTFINSDYGDLIRNIAKEFDEFTSKFVLTDDQVENLTTGFKGLFDILDMVRQMMGSSLTFVVTALKVAFGDVNMDITELIAHIGIMLSSIRDWYTANSSLQDIMTSLGTIFGKIVGSFLNVIEAIGKSSIITTLLKTFTSVCETTYKIAYPIFGHLTEAISEFFKELATIGDGNGTLLSKVGSAFKTFGENVRLALDSIRAASVLIGNSAFISLMNSIKKVISGLGQVASKAKAPLKQFGSILIDVLKGVPWGSVAALGAIASEVYAAYKIGLMLGKLVEPMKAFNAVLAAVKSLIFAFRYLTFAAMFTVFAAGILALAKALKTIEDVSIVNLIKAASALTVLGVAIYIINLAISKMPLTDIVLGSTMFLAFAVSILALAGAVKVLSTVAKDSNSWASLGIIAALMAEMVVSMMLISVLAPSLDKGALVMVSFAGSIAILAISIRLLTALDFGSVIKKFNQMVALFTLLAGVMALARLAGGYAAKFGAGMVALSFGFLVMTSTILIINNVNIGDIVNAIEILGVIAGFFIAFAIAAKIGGEYAGKVGVGLLAMTGAMSLMVGLLVVVSWLSIETLKKGLVTLGILTVFLDSMAICIGLVMSGRNYSELNAVRMIITQMTIMVGVLAAAVVAMSFLDADKVKTSIAAIGVIAAGLAAMMAAVAKTKNVQLKDLVKRLDDMIYVLLALAAVGAIIALVSNFVKDTKNMLTLAASMSLVMVSMALAMKAMDKVQEVKLKPKTVLALTAFMAATGVILGLASGLLNKFGSDIPSMLALAVGISGVLVVMAASLKILDEVKIAKNTSDAIYSMAVALFTIGIGMAMVTSTDVNWTKALSAATGMSICLAAMTGCMLALNNFMKKAITTEKLRNIGIIFGVLSVAIVAIGGAIAIVLSQNANAGQILAAGSAIVIALGVLSACGVALANISDKIEWKALGKAAVVLFGMEAALAVLVLILEWINSMGDTSQAQSTLTTLTTTLVTLVACAIALSLLGKVLGEGGLAVVGTGILAFAAVIASLFVITALIGNFSDKLELVQRGIEVLNTLAKGIGEFIGNIVGGFTSSLLDGVGEGLSNFWESAQPFIEGVSALPNGVGENLESLCSGILKLTESRFIDGITTFLGGSTDMSEFGTKMGYLADGLSAFSKGTTDVNPADIQPKANAVVELAEALGNLPKDGGWVQKILGSHEDYSSFADGLTSIAEPLTVMSEMEVNEKNVKSVASCIKALAEAANTTKLQNGILQDLIGQKQDLTEFAMELNPKKGDGSASASNIGRCLIEISEYGADVNKKKVAAVAYGIKTLAEAANSMPRSNGVLQEYIGYRDDLRQFAMELNPVDSSTSIGAALAAITQQSSNVDQNAIANVAGAITTLENSLPSTTGKLQEFFTGGTIDMGEFGTELGLFGDGVSDFIDKISGLDAESAAKVNIVSTFITKLSQAVSSIDLGGWGSTADVTSFGDQINGFGYSIVEFSKKVKDLDTESLDECADSLKKFVANLNDIAKDASTDTSQIENLLTIAGDNISTAFVSEIDDADAKARAKIAIDTLISAMATEVKNTGYKSLKGPIHSAVYRLTGLVTSQSDNQYTARAILCGKYLIEGLRQGLQNESETSSLYQAAVDIINNTLDKMQKTADEHSPSKKTTKIGKYLSQGLANGINDYGKYATKAAEGVTSDTLSAMQSSVDGVMNLLGDDFDASPVVSPVMDLSGIQNGINSANKLINGQNLAFATSMSAGTVSSMQQSSSNLGFGDIVSKLDELGKQMSGNGGNNNYTINGLTYSDGTEISSAIQSLVRAAKIERRM